MFGEAKSYTTIIVEPRSHENITLCSTRVRVIGIRWIGSNRRPRLDEPRHFEHCRLPSTLSIPCPSQARFFPHASCYFNDGSDGFRFRAMIRLLTKPSTPWHIGG